MKSSFLTFGNKEDSDTSINPGKLKIQPPAQPKEYNMTNKTKIADLNKQSKNYNMPISLENRSMKKKLINYDEIAKVKGIIE
jgi:hypothetical protein